MQEIPATLVVGFTMDGCIFPVFYFFGRGFQDWQILFASICFPFMSAV